MTIVLVFGSASAQGLLQMDTWFTTQGKSLYSIGGAGGLVFAAGKDGDFVKFDGVNEWPLNTNTSGENVIDITMQDFSGNIVGVASDVDENVYQYDNVSDSWTFIDLAATYYTLAKTYILSATDLWAIGEYKIYRNEGMGWNCMVNTTGFFYTGMLKLGSEIYISAVYGPSYEEGCLYKVNGPAIEVESLFSGVRILDIAEGPLGTLLLMTSTGVMSYDTSLKTATMVFPITNLEEPIPGGYKLVQVSSGNLILITAENVYSNLGGWHVVSGLYGFSNGYAVDEHHIYFVSSSYVYLYDQASGIIEEVNDDFGFGPNPATSQITITGDLADKEIKLINSGGQVVLSRSLSSAESFTIDLSGLSSGLYLLQMNCQGKTTTKKLVKK